MKKVEYASLILLWGAIAAYSIYFMRLTFGLYDRLAETAYDLGIFDQAVWLISRGHSAFVTMRGMHLLADHFSAILYLMAPLYWIWDSPKMLLSVQSIALALGALPVYALTRHKICSAPIALLMSIAYLLYPAMEWTNTFDFHPEALGTPMLLAEFYYLSTGNWRWYFLMTVLTLMTKETAGLTIILLGLYAIILKQWRIGFFSIGFGALSLAVALWTIQHLNQGAPSPYWSLYSPYGSSLTSLAGNILHHPARIIIALNTDVNQRYLAQLMQPVVFLPLLAPEVLCIAVPSLLPHVAHRVQIYTFPNPFYQVGWGNSAHALNQELGYDYPLLSHDQFENAISHSAIDYVALNPPTSIFPLPAYYYNVLVTALLQNPSYSIIDIGRYTILLRRGANHQKGLQLLEALSGVRINNENDVEEAYNKWSGES